MKKRAELNSLPTRRPVLMGPSLRGLAGLVVGAAAGSSALAQPEFQFRVNAATPEFGFFLEPPTIGLVYAGDGIGGNETDAMVFSWPNDFIGAVAIPVCDRLCGGEIVPEAFGGGKDRDTSLYLRRFTPTGVPIDGSDIVVAVSDSFVHGAHQTPSVAVRRVNTGVGRTNPFRLAWWDMWSWSLATPPCGPTTCNTHPVGWWQVQYPNFTSPLPTGGSALFSEPAWCRGHRPSAAYSDLRDLVAWRDVLNPCRRILGGFDGVYEDVPLPNAVEIRVAGPGLDVDRPCAAAHGGNQFLVAWREDELGNFNSAIYVRRVAPDAGGGPPVLGAVIQVTPFGSADQSSGPAVTAFEDGSFAVQWIGFENGDPPRQPLLVQRYDAQEPPNPVGGVIEVVNDLCSGARTHTISARGSSYLGLPGEQVRLSSVYELPNAQCGPLNVFGTAIDPECGALGARVVIPLNDPIEFGNRLGEPHQHTALVRSDLLTAVTWLRAVDGNVYATARLLPPPNCNPCPVDIDGSGIVDADDIFAFLNIWFAGPPGGTCSGCTADWDGDGFITADDIFAYLNDWFAFGPGSPCP